MNDDDLKLPLVRKVAAVQCDVKFSERSRNLDTLHRHLQSAAAAGSSLVVFPECMLCGYTFHDRAEASAAAITIEDPAVATIAGWIKQYQSVPLAVSVGTLLKDGDQLFNAALLINGDGLVAQYHKCHLPALGVDQFVDRGNGRYESHQVHGIGVGMAICYDCSFPEPMRLLGLSGVDVVALGTNWPVAAARTAEVVPAARSMENHYYFIAANRIGHERGFTFCGRSSITGPDGVILSAAADDQETILYADIDLSIARNKRIERTAGSHVIDRMADRQPQMYGRISSS